MAKLISIGELIIDFSSIGNKSLKDTEKFIKNAGGAPANVCAQVCKLKENATYLSMVSDDGFGDFLIESLTKVGINTNYIKKSKKYDTSLAFVSIKENGEREFCFFRKNAADLHFTPNDFNNVKFDSDDIFEFGSVALNSLDARNTHNHLIKQAIDHNLLVAFDPNIRLNLWEDIDELKKYIKEYLNYVDILKISDDELEFITSIKDENKAINYLFSCGIKLILLTKGNKGAKLYLKNKKTYDHSGFKVNSIDTTGAGDSFFGGFLSCLLKYKINKNSLLDESIPYDKFLAFACKCGAYTTTGYGAISSMKGIDELGEI